MIISLLSVDCWIAWITKIRLCLHHHQQNRKKESSFRKRKKKGRRRNISGDTLNHHAAKKDFLQDVTNHNRPSSFGTCQRPHDIAPVPFLLRKGTLPVAFSPVPSIQKLQKKQKFTNTSSCKYKWLSQQERITNCHMKLVIEFSISCSESISRHRITNHS